MNRYRQLQVSQNAATREGWNCFASHRERVTDLLLECQSGDQRTLCVLGAGNCNDLALDRLGEAFASVDLVDLDEEAVNAGIARQAVAAGRVKARGGMDVTGVAHILSQWAPEVPVTNEQVDVCITHARRFVLPLDENGYSVVTSIGLLSQLIGSIVVTLGANHPRFFDVVTSIRREHLRQLMDLTMPGGVMVLITDVVSSLTLAELATASSDELPRLVGHAIAHRNFFTGVNPQVIRQMLETEPPFASQLTNVGLSDPWIWDLGPRLYAVCALTAKRV